MIEALAALKRPSKVILHTDSQYVQKGITEWIHGWKAKGGYGSQGDGAGRANAARETVWFSPHCLDPKAGRLFT